MGNSPFFKLADGHVGLLGLLWRLQQLLGMHDCEIDGEENIIKMLFDVIKCEAFSLKGKDLYVKIGKKFPVSNQGILIDSLLEKIILTNIVTIIRAMLAQKSVDKPRSNVVSLPLTGKSTQEFIPNPNEKAV